MAFRVTTEQTRLNFIDQITTQRRNLEDVRREISSGVIVVNPSDNPGRSGTISQLISTLERLERHQKRMTFARTYLGQQEEILSSSNDLLIRARELAQQAGNETNSVQSRQQIAEEVFQLRDQLVSLANQRFQGNYIYHGSETGTEPFQAAAGGYTNPAGTGPETIRYTYQNDTTNFPGAGTTRSIRVSDNDTIRLNTAGNTVFQNAISALERLGRSLEGYRTELTGGLPDGNGTAYTFPADFDEQTANILAAMDAIESARSNDIGVEMSSIGGRFARIDQAEQILEQLKDDTNASRATLQDADLFDAASRFASLETALQGLLSSGSRINDLTLLNFI